MNYRIEKVKHYGSCNFCQKGELTKTKIGLKYPYKKVYVIVGNSLEIRICKKCLTALGRIK